MLFLPSSSRVTARTCVPRVSPLTRVCNKKGYPLSQYKYSVADVAPFIRRLLANSRPDADESRVQTLFRDVPREYTKFSAHLVATAVTQPQETSAATLPTTGIAFFPPLLKIWRPSEMSTYFYRICSMARRGVVVAYRFVELYGDAWNVTQLCGYVRTISNLPRRSAIKCNVKIFNLSVVKVLEQK